MTRRERGTLDGHVVAGWARAAAGRANGGEGIVTRPATQGAPSHGMQQCKVRSWVAARWL